MKEITVALKGAFLEKEKRVIQSYLDLLLQNNIAIADYDFSRPWGGFVRMEEAAAPVFAALFFTGLALEKDIFKNRISPKLLFVKPQARLSWQYHYRRSELWQVLEGPVGIVRSKSDDETPTKLYQAGDRVRLAQGERHRLVGLDSLGVVAEFWQHTQPDHLSDEKDIVRLQDDYARK